MGGLAGSVAREPGEQRERRRRIPKPEICLHDESSVQPQCRPFKAARLLLEDEERERERLGEPTWPRSFA